MEVPAHRLGLHDLRAGSPTTTPSRWAEAKVSGRVVETTDAARLDVPHRFVVDVVQVVLTTVGASGDHLLVRSWRPGRSVVRHGRR